MGASPTCTHLAPCLGPHLPSSHLHYLPPASTPPAFHRPSTVLPPSQGGSQDVDHRWPSGRDTHARCVTPLTRHLRHPRCRHRCSRHRQHLHRHALRPHWSPVRAKQGSHVHVAGAAHCARGGLLYWPSWRMVHQNSPTQPTPPSSNPSYTRPLSTLVQGHKHHSYPSLAVPKCPFDQALLVELQSS